MLLLSFPPSPAEFSYLVPSPIIEPRTKAYCKPSPEIVQLDFKLAIPKSQHEPIIFGGSVPIKNHSLWIQGSKLEGGIGSGRTQRRDCVWDV